MITTGPWRRQLWCADSWGVELPLVFLEGLILDQDLAPFSFCIHVKGWSQLSVTVGILILKTIVMIAIPTTGMLE